MPVRRRPPRRLDMPPPDFAEEMRLAGDVGTPLDEEKWERWTCARSAPRPWSYREVALRLLEEKGCASAALAFDPDPAVAARAAAILAGRADKTAEWYLHASVGWGTGTPPPSAGPEVWAAWRAERAAPYREAAGFWRERVAELERRREEHAPAARSGEPMSAALLQ